MSEYRIKLFSLESIYFILLYCRVILYLLFQYSLTKFDIDDINNIILSIKILYKQPNK